MNGSRLAFLACGFMVLAADGGTIQVPAELPTIQAAIDAAEPLDTIIVSPGVYNERINFLGKAITLRSSDGPDVTTIDGRNMGQGNSVVTISSGEGSDTVLRGFKIIGGNAGRSGQLSPGGGMTVYYSSPTLLNCTFQANYASHHGGGLANYYSNPTLTDCTFTNNLVADGGDGGGVYNHYGSPHITDCTFTGNTTRSAPGYGGGNGGGFFSRGGSPTVTGCTFTGNNGGGGMYSAEGSPIVTNCLFSGNANVGLYAGDGSPWITNTTFIGNQGIGLRSEGTITNCTFSGNTIGMMTGDSSKITDSIFIRNASTISSSAGGAGIQTGGSNPDIKNCVFVANSAHAGGGIYVSAGAPTIRNCSFVGNRASASGGGIFTGYGFPAVTNCSFSGNGAGNPSGGGMYGPGRVVNSIFWGNLPGEIGGGSGTLTISYSELQGGFPIGATNGGGNIYNNPRFVRSPSPGLDGVWGSDDDDYGDLRLASESPCIDSGDPSFGANPGDPTEDLDGNPRVLGDGVDMGAFEFQGKPQFEGPDFDGDGIPDIRDADIDDDGIPNTFDECDYTPLGVAIDGVGRPLADLNHDCVVDLADFALLQHDLFGPE